MVYNSLHALFTDQGFVRVALCSKFTSRGATCATLFHVPKYIEVNSDAAISRSSGLLHPISAVLISQGLKVVRARKRDKGGRRRQHRPRLTSAQPIRMIASLGDSKRDIKS